jgi:hypothetical protein
MKRKRENNQPVSWVLDSMLAAEMVTTYNVESFTNMFFLFFFVAIVTKTISLTSLKLITHTIYLIS